MHTPGTFCVKSILIQYQNVSGVCTDMAAPMGLDSHYKIRGGIFMHNILQILCIITIIVFSIAILRMLVKCIKRIKCGRTGHGWDTIYRKYCVCWKCGKRKKHDWNGCECRRCGLGRNEQHEWELSFDWDECWCKWCGSKGNHDWDGCKCKRCGKIRSNPQTTGH